MESVVPGLELTAKMWEPVWLEDDAMESDPGLVSPTGTGEWLNALGFDMCYRGVLLGGFQKGASGSALERVQAVALELMSQVQDLVTEATTEPWPLVVVDGRRNMALAGATIEGDVLHMWYGDRGAPALTLLSVQLV